LATGFKETKAASSAEMELLGLDAAEVVTMDELVNKVKETSDSGSGDSIGKEYIMIPVEVLEQYRSLKPKTVKRGTPNVDYLAVF